MLNISTGVIKIWSRALHTVYYKIAERRRFLASCNFFLTVKSSEIGVKRMSSAIENHNQYRQESEEREVILVICGPPRAVHIGWYFRSERASNGGCSHLAVHQRVRIACLARRGTGNLGTKTQIIGRIGAYLRHLRTLSEALAKRRVRRTKTKRTSNLHTEASTRRPRSKLMIGWIWITYILQYIYQLWREGKCFAAID